MEKEGTTDELSNDSQKGDTENQIEQSSECQEVTTDLQSHEIKDGHSATLSVNGESEEVPSTETKKSEEVTDMEYRTDVVNGDDTSDSDSDSSDESEDSSDENANQDAEKTINNTIASVRDFSPERKVKLNRHGFEDIRTKGELMPEELPPLEELTITVDESVEMVEVGTVDSVVGVLVVVKSIDNVPPLNDDTILFVEGHTVLGQVFEVFGPVKAPWYSVRFNDASKIEMKGIMPGTKVYCAPKEESFTKFVFVDSLKKIKGSDASWEDNNEPPDKYIEYSDDEEEKRAKAKRKNKNKPVENNGEEDEEEQKKNKKNMQSWPPRDDSNRRNNNRQGQGRGHFPNPRSSDIQANNFGHRQYRPRMDTRPANHRPWTPFTSQRPRGPHPRFGGPPNFQNNQQYDNQVRQPFNMGNNHPDVFAGNQRPSHPGGYQFGQQSQDPVQFNFNVPPPEMNCVPPQNSQQRFQGPRINAGSGHQSGPCTWGPPPGTNMGGPSARPFMDGSSSRFPGAHPRGPLPSLDTGRQPPGPNMGGPFNTNIRAPTWQNMEVPHMNVVCDDRNQRDNSQRTSHMEQHGPNQFRVHDLNPGPSFSNNTIGEIQHSSNRKYDQPNLSGNNVGPYRPNIHNDNPHMNTSRQCQNMEPVRSQSSELTMDYKGQNLNSAQMFVNPNQMTKLVNSNQVLNTPNIPDNKSKTQAFFHDNQGQNTGLGHVNQGWNTNNSPLDSRQMVLQNMNSRTGQPQNFGTLQPGNIQMAANSVNQDYQTGKQINVNAGPNVFQNMTSQGSAAFPPPFTNRGQENLNCTNGNVQNSQNQNRAPQIIDPRFIQGS